MNVSEMLFILTLANFDTRLGKGMYPHPTFKDDHHLQQTKISQTEGTEHKCYSYHGQPRAMHACAHPSSWIMHVEAYIVRISHRCTEDRANVDITKRKFHIEEIATRSLMTLRFPSGMWTDKTTTVTHALISAFYVTHTRVKVVSAPVKKFMGKFPIW